MKGIKLSKPGYDVFADTPTNQYVEPDTPLFKVAVTGSGTITFGASDVVKQVVIDHDLGYVPQHAIFAEAIPSSSFVRLVNASQISLTTDYVAITAAITESQIAIQMTALVGDPTGDYSYLYQIYHDEAE